MAIRTSDLLGRLEHLGLYITADLFREKLMARPNPSDHDDMQSELECIVTACERPPYNVGGFETG